IQKIRECKFSGLARNSINIPVERSFVFNVHKHAKVYGVCIVRNQSTVDTTVTEAVSKLQPDTTANDAVYNTVNNAIPERRFISEIPDPPAPFVEQIAEAVKFHANGESTFQSIGLGGWSPVGLIQHYFEWIHITCDMPWWAAITLTTAFLKIVAIPLLVDTMKNNIKTQNVLPELLRIQENLTEARNCGNKEEATEHAYHLQMFYKKNNIKIFPLSNIVRFGMHIPVFFALRGMANAPVESLKYGGVWWFTDLTIADPYYILPAFTSATLFIVANYSLKSVSASNMSPLVRYAVQGMPLVAFLFVMNFPGALLLYWVTSNLITVVQTEMFKLEPVKAYLNLPVCIKHKTPIKPKSNKSFRQAFSESWSNLKVTNKLAAHAKADLYQFNSAGKAAVKKTYKYNPVRGVSRETSAASVLAKKK
ncbi:Mitochondrial inner membrane protein OXA1L, partial [Habropoda laboriosa]